MSLDPSTLKEGDKVRFSDRITKCVVWVGHSTKIIYFSDRSEMRHTDTIWDLAELVKPGLPEVLTCGYLGIDDSYHVDDYPYTPEKLLKLLKQDVAALETAGVEEKE